MPSLQEILSSASAHPIYTPLLQKSAIAKNVSSVPAPSNVEEAWRSDLSLTDFPFLVKDHLISSFQTLIRTDPTFLHSAYLSPTGGTRGGSTQLYFVTATADNRAQRRVAADMYANLRVIEKTDIFMNLHGGIAMYRGQDLTSTLIDLAGGTELSIGGITSDAETLEIARMFRPNAIFSTSSRVLQFAKYVATLPESERLRVRKVIYTSEPLPPAQEVFLHEALGVELIGSCYGSAEAGPMAGAPPIPIRTTVEGTLNGNSSAEYREFVFDRKMVVIEIINAQGETIACSIPGQELGSGEVGEIILTSLDRLKNPLVRYRTGDLGSLHALHDMSLMDETKRGDYLRFRSYGRNPMMSFFIDSEYIDVVELQRRIFSKPEHDVLEWQVIISPLSAEEMSCEEEGTKADGLEFRIVTKGEVACGDLYEKGVQKDLIENIIGPNIKITVKRVGYDGMVKGKTGRKIVKVQDKR